MLQLSISDLLVALVWSDLWWWVDVIVKVAVALGTVVFVHELGHFLMAKACGVKVEKFMIGFDIGGYKISRRWGETLYGIGILPLGGYVKMFGQDDDPSHIAEQMQKSQVSAGSGDAVAKTGPNGETYYIDRRSYLAKSVPQRMAIISAGVIMNVIFAFIFAAIAYGMGVEYLPCIVSGTVPGSPAWQARLEPGDEIIQLGEQKDPTFMQLRGGVTLGDLERGIPCLVRRASDDEVVPLKLKPIQEEGELATVGIAPPMTLSLVKKMPVAEGSAAAQAKLVSPATSESKEEAFEGDDRIVAVGDVPVANFREFASQLARASSRPLLITVRRKIEMAAAGSANGDAAVSDEGKELQFEVPTQPLRDLGLVMKMGPITAVQEDSPADKAGLAAGDVIELVDGQPIADGSGAGESWNPVTLPGYLLKAAEEGREVEFSVRKSGGPSKGESANIRLTPVVPIVVNSGASIGAPMGADAIGIAYRIENEVHAVLPSGPAAHTKIAAGDQIVGAQIIFPMDKKGKTEEPEQVEFGPKNANWPALVYAVQFAPPGTRVELHFERGKNSEPVKVEIEPKPVEGALIAPRGFIFEPIFRTRQAATFSEAVRLGWEETTEALSMVLRFLQKLGGQVPFKMLGGPGTIAYAAGDAASHGLSSLLIFLTMLSANLAVINFLPIPLLDGGHMVFLAYEGIRGRPANEKFVLAMHMAGFVFIIGLMLFVIGLDIDRWIL